MWHTKEKLKMEIDISMSEEAKHSVRKRRVLKLSIFLLVLDIILVGFTYLVLINNNQRNAKKTGEVMLNQMCSILEKISQLKTRLWIP